MNLKTDSKLMLGLIAFLAGSLISGCARAPEASKTPKFKMTTKIPESITTPDRVETRIGTLKFFDGAPSKATIEKAYDNLDFLRGVEVFLDTIPAASLVAVRAGFREVGAADGTIGIFEELMDARSLFLTPNTESIYSGTWLDLTNGPVVVESPPNVLGIVDDFWFRYVADLGNAGPDRGQGGKFLFLPPDYKGKKPDGYFIFRSSTYGNILMWRSFLVDGDPKPGVASLKKYARVYPLAMAGNPPEQKFINLSGREFNTIHANNYEFYEDVNEVVQEEPTAAADPDTLGLLASIGIVKGQPFAPDKRLKTILAGTPAGTTLTAPGTTNFICRRKCRPGTSGPSARTTTRPGPCCRLTSGTRAS